MAITGFSHAAIGVTDPERSIKFYRDVLGLTLVMDTEERGDGPPPVHRRAIYFRWDPSSIAGFIVLDYHFTRPPHGKPLNMFDVGTHHISFAIDDVHALYARAKRFGCEILGEPRTRSGVLWGMPGDTEPAVMTLIIKDPDGNLLQFDEWITRKS
jgi:catechol 2,3-dioxygenase-like lactoylglutathione lyase family enzyme